MRKELFALAGAALALAAMAGKGLPKYRLILERHGLKSEKTEYTAGEEVRVTFGMIATDTDYRFTADSADVKLKQDYSPKEGYILTFVMPDHDVRLKAESRNSMTALPNESPWR